MTALATAALTAIVLTFSVGASAADVPHPAGAKPSSFAPRHSGRRVYGTPIQPPILGSRKGAHHKATPTVKRAKATSSSKPPKTMRSGNVTEPARRRNR